ncbi:class I SAM-dependent methyltransferase (plasmid) [Achromobacter seleniivolatilans]|uniref:Class I SAM-dependent methyltransferase n=1 Tax=Achromobacter seleniivolatilans TaxID=3047478 RepID=A0ABY9MAN8_9BURK|nr:class I SAM-dependent methyltransferase [Achromobacter sp. R39]WMD24050.1 class I SAM-dependent methyltransferase [Achromobacter sp. R39]
MTHPDTRMALGQFPTPGWAAEALYERHFSHLTRGDVVWEPTCGPGSFLAVIPQEVDAFGSELDPHLARAAAAATGRLVLQGDFETVTLPATPTAVIGNPPFQLDLIDRLLRRAHAVLPSGGQAAFLLPAYAFQTAARVAGYAEDWSIAQEMVPRNIYPGLKLPLVFATFTKDGRRRLFGFALYRETADVHQFPRSVRAQLEGHRGPVWARAVEAVLRLLGGEADLASIYQALAPARARPSENPWWKEKVRQTLRRYERFRRVGGARYALADAAPALGVQLVLI